MIDGHLHAFDDNTYASYHSLSQQDEMTPDAGTVPGITPPGLYSQASRASGQHKTHGFTLSRCVSFPFIRRYILDMPSFSHISSAGCILLMEMYGAFSRTNSLIAGRVAIKAVQQSTHHSRACRQFLVKLLEGMSMPLLAHELHAEAATSRHAH